MRKFILPVLVLSFLATFAAAPVAASAASCSVSGNGGEKAPTVAGDGSVAESGAQGYKCTVAWDADVQPQYESGGTWHYCAECAPAFHPNTPDQFQPANTPYNWSNSTFPDGDHVWFPTASGDTPVCMFNWRLQVNFFGTNHFVFQSDVSPQTNKTC